MHSRRWRRLFLGGIGLVLLHALLWFAMVTWIGATVADQATLLRERGWKVDLGAMTYGGWPFAERVGVPGLRLIHTASGNAWQSAQMDVAFDLRHPSRLDVTLTGPHVAAMAGGAPVAIEGAPILVVVALAEPHRIDITADELGLYSAAGVVTLKALAIEAEPGADPGASAAVASDSVGLRATVADLDLGALLPASTLGSRLDRVVLDAGLNALKHPDPRAWRDAGGQLALHRLALHWSRFDMELGGVIGLDANLQPEGNGMIAAGGLPEAIDAMVGAGVIPAGTARTAKALLRLVPRTPDGKLTVPLALKDRRLSAALLPIGVLPMLRWPDMRGP